MEDYQLRYLKSRLIEEETECENALKDNEDLNTGTLLAANEMELSLYDNHPADTASETFEIEKQIAIKRHYEKRMADIKHALDKIDRNTYGTCEACGKDIDFERLEALPTSKLCIKCEKDINIAIKDIQNTDRPVEEDVLKPPFYRTDTDGHDYVGYDGEDAWQDVAKYNKTPNYALDWYDNNFYDEHGKLKDSPGSIEDISNEEYKSQLPE